MNDSTRYSTERLEDIRTLLVAPDLPPEQLPPEPLPDDEVDLLVHVLASASFTFDKEFSPTDPTDPHDIDQGVVWLAKDILRIYAKTPFNIRAARLELLLVLLRVVRGLGNGPASRLINDDDSDGNVTGTDLLATRINADNPDHAIRGLGGRLPDRELKNAFLFLTFPEEDAEQQIEGSAQQDLVEFVQLFLTAESLTLPLRENDWQPTRRNSDPETLQFWLEPPDHWHALGEGIDDYFHTPNLFEPEIVFTAAFPLFKELSAEAQAEFVHKVLFRVFAYWSERNSDYPHWVLKLYLQQVRGLVNQAGTHGDSSLHDQLESAWMLLALLMTRWSRTTTDRIDAEERAQLVQVARKGVGLLSSQIRAARDENQLALNEPWLRNAIAIIHVFDDTSFNLKHLSLAIWAAGFPVVLPDLRYWIEQHLPNDPFPKAAFIPERISWVLRMLHDYQAEDPELRHLREHYAEFCLSRLGSRSKNPKTDEQGYALESELKEQSSAWRLAFIEAASALRVKSKGRGHHVLHWVSKNDPREDVRKAARAAEKPMRHGSPLPPGASPRRPLFAAFWFLRRAHLQALGVSVDTAGANRTRMKEVTYSREN